MNQMTAIIKTFERPECVRTLVRSIRQYYPRLPIIIADDSRDPVTFAATVDVHPLPFDVGLSAGRNYLLRQVKTPYFLLLDDDFEFTAQTKVEKLLARARQGFDVVSGQVNGKDYCGTLEIENGVLYYRKKARNTYKRSKMYDLTWNFFVGDTEKIKAIGWDERLKLAEHTDFFLRAKGQLRISHHKSVNVYHHCLRSADYKRYRQRALFYTIRMMKKHNLHTTVGFDGETHTIREYVQKYRKIKDRLAAV